MARSHAASGALVGVSGYWLAAPAEPRLTIALLSGIMCAGFAILPDLDHPDATATHMLGKITRSISWCVRGLCRVAYHSTRTPRDRADVPGEHRSLTHSAAFAVGVGALAVLAVELAGPWASAVQVLLYGLGVLLAAAGIGEWLVLPGGAIVALAVAELAAADGAAMPPPVLIGFLMTAGCLVHCAGDMITYSGVPLCWPLVLNGRRWRRVFLPRAVCFSTGSRVETAALRPAMTAAYVLLLVQVAVASA